MAAGALHGQAEKGPGEGVDAVGQRLGFGLRLRLRIATIGFIVGSDSEEACSIKRERFVDQVAGDLVFDELVIGEIAVETVYHPVTVVPGARQRAIVAEASQSVAVARGVEPVPGPAFTVMRRVQQGINHVVEGVGPLVS